MNDVEIKQRLSTNFENEKCYQEPGFLPLTFITWKKCNESVTSFCVSQKKGNHTSLQQHEDE